MLNIYFYKLFNPDIQHLNNNQLVYHWNTIGKNEDRINSIESFFDKYKSFNYKKYILFNPDLKNINEKELLIHWHTVGRFENRVYSNEDFYNIYPTFNLNIYKSKLKNFISENDDEYLYKWHNEDKNNDGVEKYMNEEVITFIIISSNYQKTLNTITSLKNIETLNWVCYIVYNNVNYRFDDLGDSFKSIIFDEYKNKYFIKNNIIKTLDYEWITFITEGIYLNPLYIHNFNKILKKYDIIVYKYYVNNNIIIPDDLLSHNMEFTYIIKKNDDLKNLLFTNFTNDNYLYLTKCMKMNCKIFFSNEINYYYILSDVSNKDNIVNRNIAYIYDENENENENIEEFFLKILLGIFTHYKYGYKIYIQKNSRYELLSIWKDIPYIQFIGKDEINLNEFDTLSEIKDLSKNIKIKSDKIINSIDFFDDYENLIYSELKLPLSHFSDKILLCVSSDFNNMENFYINALATIDFTNTDIYLFQHGGKKISSIFLDNLNPIIINNLFDTTISFKYIISFDSNYALLASYLSKDCILFFPTSNNKYILKNRNIIFVNNDISTFFNKKVIKTPYIINNKYFLVKDNILYNTDDESMNKNILYANQYILNKMQYNFEYLSQNNYLEESSLSDKNSQQRFFVILFHIDNIYNKNQLINILNQNYNYFYLFIYIDSDKDSTYESIKDLIKKYDNVSIIYKTMNFDSMLKYIKNITLKDQYIIYINSNIIINNSHFLLDIHNKLNTFEYSMIYFDYLSSYFKIYVFQKELLNELDNYYIKNDFYLFNLLYDRISNSNKIHSNNYYFVIIDDKFYKLININNYINNSENKKSSILFNDKIIELKKNYMIRNEDNINERIKNYDNSIKDIDNLSIMLYQYNNRKNKSYFKYESENCSEIYFIYSNNIDNIKLFFEKNKNTILFTNDDLGIQSIKIKNNMEILSHINHIFIYCEKNHSFINNLTYMNIDNDEEMLSIDGSTFKKYGYFDIELFDSFMNTIDYFKIKSGEVLENTPENKSYKIKLYETIKIFEKNIYFYYLRNRYVGYGGILDKIKTFYINLDLREDRYKHITRECRRMGLMSCEKFSAIKPKIEDVRRSNMININKMWKKDDKYLIGAYGCKMSHLEALKKALKESSNYKYILLLEDDCVFDDNALLYIYLSIKYIEDYNIKFDILYLSSNLAKKEDAELVGESLLRIYKGLTTTGQIFLYDNLEKIIDVIENSEREIDNTYQDLLRDKYSVYPMCAYQMEFFSDINSKKMNYGMYHRKFYY
jgi:GR25 family glycosyltransferase involved in LPS biosynthesis